MSGCVDKMASCSTEERTKEKLIRKRRRVPGEKVCQVCGDRALAHHFGALTCDTCKAFFRRHALEKVPWKCVFSGNCVICVRTRRFCPACRLAKCFSVGMQTDLIMDQEEKKEWTKKVNVNRAKKEPQQSSVKTTGVMKQGLHSPAETDSAWSDSTSAGHRLSPNPLPAHLAPSVEPLNPAPGSHNLVEPLSPLRGSQNLLERDSKSASVTDNKRTGLSSPPEFCGRLTPTPSHCTPASPASAPSLDTWQSTLTPAPPATQTPLASLVSPVAASECFSDTWQSALTPPPSAAQAQLTNQFSAASASPSVCSPDTWQSALTPPPPPPATQTPLTNAASVSGGRQQERRPAAHFKHVALDLLPSDPFLYWRLTDEERSLLTQLSAAYQDTVLSVLKGSPPRGPIPPDQMTKEVFCRALDGDAHTVVNFAKRMEDFRQLRQDEQIALIKASSYQVLGIRDSALFITEKDVGVTSLGYFTSEHCDILIPGYPLLDQTLQFNRIMKSIAKNDSTLYALLHCLVLFDPCDERVIDRQLINAVRDKYVILLRHYLASVYSYQYYEKYMVALMENLSSYRSLCEQARELIDEWFPGVPSKLLVEILDM